MNRTKSKIYQNKKWRQRSIRDYFSTRNACKSKIYCENCRRKFESSYHLKYHLSTVVQCRDPYSEPSRDVPKTLLQHMSEEVLYLISDFLLLKDLVNFIHAMPRLLICQGMKILWMRRMDRRHPRFTPRKMHITVSWLVANHFKFLSIDKFICIESQGNDSHDEVDPADYHIFFVPSRLNSGGLPCRHLRIWYLQQYLQNEPRPLWRILF